MVEQMLSRRMKSDIEYGAGKPPPIKKSTHLTHSGGSSTLDKHFIEKPQLRMRRQPNARNHGLFIQLLFDDMAGA